MSTKVETIFKTEDGGIKITTDGFQNFVAKLGISPRGDGKASNLLSDGHYDFNLVSRNRLQLEAAYRGSWIVGRVVDTIADDMTRAGIEITTNDGAEQVDQFRREMSRLQIWQSLADNIRWGRLYGGSIAVLQIKGQDLATPLDPDTVGKGQFEGIVVYDRWQIYPCLTDIINSGPQMGLPKFYDIVLGTNLNDPSEPPDGQVNAQDSGRVRVHHSRCIRAEGVKLPFWQAITEMLWGESVLERMWDRLIAFDTATMATGSLITRAQLRTVSIDGFREVVGAGGKGLENLVASFEYMRQIQNSEGITLLDKEDVFASTAYSFAGLSDVLIQFAQQVSGSAEIPLVSLFGQSPAGLSATGESDITLYYDGINSKQESRLRNPVEMVAKVLWRSMTGQSLPSDFAFTFTPLWQMTALEKSTIAKNNTDTIIEAHQEGLIDTPTAMKELKQSSGDTGLFSNITDEQIEEAESEGPPMPGDEPTGEADPIDPEAKEKLKAAAGDSAYTKIRRWLNR